MELYDGNLGFCFIDSRLSFTSMLESLQSLTASQCVMPHVTHWMGATVSVSVVVLRVGEQVVLIHDGHLTANSIGQPWIALDSTRLSIGQHWTALPLRIGQHRIQ